MKFENYNKGIPGCLKLLEYKINFLAWQSLALIANKNCKKWDNNEILKTTLFVKKIKSMHF